MTSKNSSHAPAQMRRSALLASAISVAILSGCGGGGGSSSATPTSVNRCSDWNLNASCEAFEIHSHASLAQEGKNGPFLTPGSTITASSAVNRSGFMTAPDGAQIVSPFTTLIASELLFNPNIPALSDSEQEERLTQATTYLNSKFPELDFSRYLFQQGPSTHGQQIQASIDRALSNITDLNPYCIVAAVVDAMVINQSFDVSIQRDQAAVQCPAANVSVGILNDTLSRFETVGIAEQQDIIVAATKNELTVWSNDQLTAANASAISSQNATDNAPSVPGQKTISDALLKQLNQPLSALDDDDDNDDDVDDDDYDGGSGASNVGGGGQPTTPPVTVPVTTRQFDNITLVKPAYNTQSVYLVNSSFLTFNETRNQACDSGATGNDGLHKVQLHSNTANTLSSSSITALLATSQIPVAKQLPADITPDDASVNGSTLDERRFDAFAGATGYVPPPTTPTVPTPTSPAPGTDASCLNDAFAHLAISANEQVLMAATDKRLFRLNMENLEQIGNAYAPFADSVDINHISLSADGSLVLVSTNENRGLSLVNTATMTQAGWLSAPAEGQTELTQVKQAFFFNKHQQIAAIEGGTGISANKLHIIDSSKTNSPTVSQSMELTAPIAHISVSPDREHLAALTTDNKLWLYQLSGTVELLETFGPVAQAQQLLLQNDQALILDNTGEVLQTFNFGNRFGNPLVQAKNELSLARILGVNANRQKVNKDMFLPQSGAEIGKDLGSVTISWTSTSESAVNPTTGNVSVTSNALPVILDATLTGDYRGETITLKKSFQIQVSN